MLRSRTTRGAGVRHRPRGAFLLVAVAAMSITACSSPQPEEPEPWDLGPFADLVEQTRQEAEAGGASTEQLTLLDEAKAAGEVPVETARKVMRATVECFKASDLTAEYVEGVEPSGFTRPDYTIEYDEDRPEEETDALIESCEVRESRWLFEVYQLQPSARELLGAHVASKEPALRKCLEDNNYTTDPDADGWDLAYQAADALTETAGAVDCLTPAGISGL